MMQEEQAVGFDPVYACYVHHPWYVNLFVYYLVFALLFAIARSVRLSWTLRKRRTSTQQPKSPQEMGSQDPWERASLKAKSLKNLSHLTILISLLVLVWSLSDDFTATATQKVAGIGAIAGSAADALTTFSAGIIVSTVLFGAALFCERLIRRRKSVDSLG